MWCLTSLLAVIIFTFSYLFTKIYTKKQKLNGKTVLVTGGSNGLGQQICIKLAQQGCDVIIADILPADETLEVLKLYNVRAKAYKVDVSKFQEILTLKECILKEFKAVDILVNNAGIIPYKTIFEQSSDEIEKITKVNINSVLFMTKCFLEEMLQAGHGHIVSISSLQGIYPFPHSLIYCSSKFAVTGFMLGLKEFLRRRGLKKIYTTCILPHVIASRNDIIDIVNSDVSIVLTPETCAEIVVDAIINKRSFVTIPKSFGVLISIFNILPFFVQHFIRDFFYREHLFLKK